MDNPSEATLHFESVRSGGIDYFVSSELFEAPFGGQRRYSERLYLMRSLTTCFMRPPAPASGTLPDVRALGLPLLAPFLSENGEEMHGIDTAPLLMGGRHLYLVPQTLYKLHPDFDRLLKV